MQKSWNFTIIHYILLSSHWGTQYHTAGWSFVDKNSPDRVALVACPWTTATLHKMAA